jgi:hypothetical protein
MDGIQSGTSASRIEGAVWRKSLRSNPSGACVEVAPLSGGRIAVRDSKDARGPALVYSREEIVALFDDLKRG